MKEHTKEYYAELVRRHGVSAVARFMGRVERHSEKETKAMSEKIAGWVVWKGGKPA